jgi:hypothetical protein
MQPATREHWMQSCVISLLLITLSVFTQGQQPTGTSDGNGKVGEAAAPGFSKNFMQAGIQTMGAIKAWRSRLAYAVKRGLPGDGSGLVPMRDRASESLRLATAAASTASDQSGIQLLANHFNNVDQWAGAMIAARKSMDATASMDPDALTDDPLFQKITTCADFLPSMLASGTFADDASCH